jgi:hypothetical protein
MKVDYYYSFSMCPKILLNDKDNFCLPLQSEIKNKKRIFENDRPKAA